MERKLVAAGMAALALAIAGCGSSGPMSRADFAKQANIICSHRMAQLRAIGQRDARNIPAIVKAAYPVLQEEVRKLEGLRPPKELRSEFDSVLAFERLQVRAAAYYERTGRYLIGSTEDGAPLHRHEAMRKQLNMVACES